MFVNICYGVFHDEEIFFDTNSVITIDNYNYGLTVGENYYTVRSLLIALSSKGKIFNEEISFTSEKDREKALIYILQESNKNVKRGKLPSKLIQIDHGFGPNHKSILNIRDIICIKKDKFCPIFSKSEDEYDYGIDIILGNDVVGKSFSMPFTSKEYRDKTFLYIMQEINNISPVESYTQK